ncbi:MAG: DUF3108 domain-containing protein [Thermodesulfobacteriota bacterium]
MFKVFKAVVTAFVGLTILVVPCKAAEPAVQPFTPGEKLTFELTWGGIGAGTAVLKVLPLTTVNGAAAYGFEMTARSTKTIDRIFKIRDRLESYADRGMTHSLLYKQKIREGGYRKNRLITFDWEKNELTYISNNSKPRQVSIIPGTFDPLAAFYFLRLQPLTKVTSVECPITDGKRNVIGRAHVVGREKIQVGGRAYATIVLEPVLDDVELFNANDNSGIRIWITADARKMPVRVESRVALGFFRAELRKVEHVSRSEKQ